MSKPLESEEVSNSIVNGVLNYISSQLQTASSYFEIFADQLNEFIKGSSCKSFAEVYNNISGTFKRGVTSLYDIILKYNELYNSLYNSDFCSSVKTGQNLANRFQDCLIDSLGRLYNMSSFLMQVFDKTLECCLESNQKTKKNIFEWGNNKTSLNSIEALTSNAEYWPAIYDVFPDENYEDFCIYFSKHATVENLAILYNGFSNYFELVSKFVVSLIDKMNLYQSGYLLCDEVIKPLKDCIIKGVIIGTSRRSI